MSIESVGLMVQRLRKEKNWTLHDLSGRVGVSVSFLSFLENGKKGLRVETLFKLADALEVHPAMLFVESKKADP